MNCASFAFGNALCRMLSDIDGAHRQRGVGPGLAPHHRGGPETQRGDTPLNLDSRFL